MLDMQKMVFRLRIGSSVVSLNISSDYYSGAKNGGGGEGGRGRTFKRTEKEKKKKKIGDQQTLFMFILRDQIIILFPADTFSRKQLIFRP